MFVAPFLGEFGWEIMMWVPYVRWMRENLHRGIDFVSYCQPGHGRLYSDFSTEVVELTPEQGLPAVTNRDCATVVVRAHGRFHHDDYVNLVQRHQRKRVPKSKIITPYNLAYSWPMNGAPRPNKSKHVLYRVATEPRPGFFAIHARSSKKIEGRNWPIEKWNELLAKLEHESVIAIGTREDALCPDRCVDRRGWPIENLIHCISECSLGLGPSSGGLHLMNACGTPVAWWSGNQKDKERYESAWNPMQLPNRCVKAKWDPSPDEVLACIRDAS